MTAKLILRARRAAGVRIVKKMLADLKAMADAEFDVEHLVLTDQAGTQIALMLVMSTVSIDEALEAAKELKQQAGIGQRRPEPAPLRIHQTKGA